MSKKKITKREVFETHRTVIAVGYGHTNYLLYYKEPYAYNTGVYGWNADIYSVGTTAIVEGSRSFGVTYDFEALRAYNAKAKAIIKHKAWTNETKKNKVNDLLYEFVKGV